MSFKSDLAALLDAHAPMRACPLVPELSVFFANGLVEVWEAAEALAGHPVAAPFWAYPWPGGIAIARVLLDHPERVRGLRVLDVGCGGGIASLAAAHAGARAVVANDIDDWALQTAAISAERAGLHISTLKRDLTEPESMREKFDVVLCADLAYERRTAPLLRALLMRMHRNGASVVVADAGRKYFDAGGLKRLASFTIAVPNDLEGVDERSATVYEFV